MKDESQPSSPSDFLAAIKRLTAQPAKALREDTHLRLPITMKIGDAYRCAHLARDSNSLHYLRDEDTFKTHLILRTVNQAWKHDKLPALAVCASQRSAEALQKSAQIESVTAERFFSDLGRARPVTQTFTGTKNYVIGHDRNPEGRFDKIVLPTFANVIVYEADKFSPQELTSLCDHVAEVRGRVILCAHCKALDRAQPEIGQILNEFFGDYGPEIPFGSDTEKAWELGNELGSRFRSLAEEIESRDTKLWVVVANSPWQVGAHWVRSIHSSHEEARNAVPAVFAEEWKDYVHFFQADQMDHHPPSVSTAEWRVPAPPEVGNTVRIENDAAVSLITPHERLPLPDALREDTRETDPLAKTRPFLVFHANSEDSRLFPDHYTLVAKIHGESIDHALFLSQHTDVPWTKYPGVTPFADKPRSTRVGDVIIDHDVPVRYIAPNRWCPVTTTMDQADIQPVMPELNRSAYTPDSHEHQMTTQRLKI